MSLDFATSNLSKIAPKFRTSGAVSQPRRKAGSPLRDIGVTNAKVVKVNTQDDYLKRLYAAYDATDDPKLKKFVYTEIRKIMIQRGGMVMSEIRAGILHECDVRRAVKEHLLDCMKRPEYYNYPHADLKIGRASCRERV